ncbi:hypothetical protein [Escherichia coli]|uniref:hypothetical protein n=1 Tax=Escherichia coli TaxID=562 RepID=UPI0039DF62FC
MNFYDEGIRRNVSLHAATDKINIPGVFTIGGHGYPGFITDENGNYETAEGLAKRIRANPRYKKGMSVDYSHVVQPEREINLLPAS